jgi:hypothetical protein
MSAIANALRGILGLFFDDGTLALVILALLIVTAFARHAEWIGESIAMSDPYRRDHRCAVRECASLCPPQEPPLITGDVNDILKTAPPNKHPRSDTTPIIPFRLEQK